MRQPSLFSAATTTGSYKDASGNDIRSRIFCHKYHNAIVQNSAMDSLVLQRGCYTVVCCPSSFVRGR